MAPGRLVAACVGVLVVGAARVGAFALGDRPLSTRGGLVRLRRHDSPRVATTQIRTSRGRAVAVPAATTVTASSSEERMPMLSPMNAALFATYGVAGLVVRGVAGASPRAAASIACVWAGCVLAISFMEAVVKFRSPFLPKFFALDVGRTVFPALNAVEAALCATLWVLSLGSAWLLGSLAPLPLAMATAVLAAQVAFLTPRLCRDGERAVLAALARHPYLVKVVLTDAQRDRYCELRRTHGYGDAPAAAAPAASQKTSFSSDGGGPRQALSRYLDSRSSKTLHVFYVVGELLKLLCLGAFAAAVGG